MIFKYQKPTSKDLKRQPAQFYREATWAKRKPGNYVIALGLLAFASGAYLYTMRSVSRDDFANYDEYGNEIVGKKN